jgi:hypothetical protein
MVRINLARHYSVKKTLKNKVSYRIVIPVGILLILLVAVEMTYMYRGLIGQVRSSVYGVTQYRHVPVAVGRPVVADTAAKIAVQPTPAAIQKNRPDTLIQHPAGIPLSHALTTQMAFADNVCSLIKHTVPAGITVTSITMDSCSVIGIQGIGMSKDVVRALFAALRHEKVTIAKFPHTFIKFDKKQNGYIFFIHCRVRPGFGSDTAGVAALTVPATMDRITALADFSQLARKNHVLIQGAPLLASTEKKDGFIQSEYSFAVKTSYADFVTFIHSIRAAQLPCAVISCGLDTRPPSASGMLSRVVVLTLH